MSPANDQSRTASMSPRCSSSWSPSLIDAAARVILRVTNCSGLRSDSWLLRIPEHAYSPLRWRRAPRIWCAASFAIAYWALVGRHSVSSRCGLLRRLRRRSPSRRRRTCCRRSRIGLEHRLQKRGARARDRLERLPADAPRRRGTNDGRGEVVELVRANLADRGLEAVDVPSRLTPHEPQALRAGARRSRAAGARANSRRIPVTS